MLLIVRSFVLLYRRCGRLILTLIRWKEFGRCMMILNRAQVVGLWLVIVVFARWTLRRLWWRTGCGHLLWIFVRVVGMVIVMMHMLVSVSVSISVLLNSIRLGNEYFHGKWNFFLDFDGIGNLLFDGVWDGLFNWHGNWLGGFSKFVCCLDKMGDSSN